MIESLKLEERESEMPHIRTETLAEHRNWRRHQLIEAAAAIALESGAEAITVGAVAQRAGLSRTSIYEYFASSADLCADLVIEELDTFNQTLAEAISGVTDPEEAISKWIRASLAYIADGRHLLAKALNTVTFPDERKPAIGAAHRALLTPLIANLEKLKIGDIHQALTLIQSVTDAAAKRIESGNDADAEIETTTAFCIAGILALVK